MQAELSSKVRASGSLDCDVGLSAKECRAIGAIRSCRIQFRSVTLVARTIGARLGNVRPRRRLASIPADGADNDQSKSFEYRCCNRAGSADGSFDHKLRPELQGR